MLKIVALIVLIGFYMTSALQAGYIDRSVAHLVWRGAKHVVTDFPLITGIAVAILFRHQLINLLIEQECKNPFALIGEHPFLCFFIGLGLLRLFVNPTS